MPRTGSTAKGAKGDTGATGAAGGTGPSGTTKLFDSTLLADTATIDTNPTSLAGYDLLETWIYARTDEAVGFSLLNITVNNDTSSIYDQVAIQGVNATASANNQRAAANWQHSVAGASCAAGVFAVIRLVIPCYAQTVGNKSGECSVGIADSVAANCFSLLRQCSYRSTAAITRIAITPNTAGKKLKTGSRMIVFGQ